jgi:hypothetical protein
LHRIHLKGPWHYEWLGGVQPPVPGLPAVPVGGTPVTRSSGRDPARPRRLPGEHRVHMPTTWQSLFGDTAGTARFRRRFHRPTNLDPDERVFLVFDGIGGRAEIRLNGRQFSSIDAAACPAGFDVTALLAPRNELTVDVVFDPDKVPGQPGGLWAPVALEIRGAG